MVMKIRVLDDEDKYEVCDTESFSRDVLEGLSKSSKAIPSRYFYDDEGGRLFRRITELSEYYLTDCEFEILHIYKSDIMNAIGRKSFNLIELGAGDGKKTKVLINHFLRNGLDIKYIPIDICHNEIANLIEKFRAHGIEVHIDGLVAEYFDGIQYISDNENHLNLALFLGSNIGNFDMDEAESFLCELRDALNNGDYLLIGFDLKKDENVLNLAYNDPENLTAEFNLNLLRRINRELDGNFDLSQFYHHGYYKSELGAMESYLVSRKDQTVEVGKLNRTFEFGKGERIHTEYSFKFSEPEINALAERCGFVKIRNYKDISGYFVDSLWQVKK